MCDDCDSIFKTKGPYACRCLTCGKKKFSSLKLYINHMMTDHPDEIHKADIFFVGGHILTKEEYETMPRTVVQDVEFFSIMEKKKALDFIKNLKISNRDVEQLAYDEDLEFITKRDEWLDIRGEIHKLLKLYRKQFADLEECLKEKFKFIRLAYEEVEKKKFLKEEREKLLSYGISREIVDAIDDKALLRSSEYDTDIGHIKQSVEESDESEDSEPEEIQDIPERAKPDVSDIH